MPLPTADTRWPPDSMKPILSKMAEWAAWYSGEPSRIIDVYGSQAQQTGAVPWWRFWSRARAGQAGAQRALLHVPLASDLAATSGALLFGEPAKIRIRSERTDTPADPAEQKGQPPTAGDPTTPPAADKQPVDPNAPPQFEPGKPPPKVTVPETPEQKAEARLLEIIENTHVHARLVEAAETAAAMGGVYIYPAFDKDLIQYPFMAIAQADQAVPEFSHGFLKAVTFFRHLESGGSEVFRHVERHEVEISGVNGETRKAVVLNALFRGTDEKLGSPVGLDVMPETARIAPRVELPFEDLDVEYVPNIRPNRLWRASGHGVADIQGSETLLDALDEVYASWMRDIRLAKARILVPREYLRSDPDDPSVPAFDVDQEVYVGMDMEPGLAQDARAMLAHQFQIRHEEHRATAHELIERIVSNAGYDPGITGNVSSQAASSIPASGASQRASEHKTLLTLRKKSGWWRAAVANVLYRMMLIDVEEFGQSYKPVKPTVLTADSIIDNPLELAQTVMAMKTAESASIETRVRILHPDWSEAEVDAEVQRINGDLEAAKPPPPVMPSFGDPKAGDAGGGNSPITQPGKPAAPNPPPPQVGAKPAG